MATVTILSPVHDDTVPGNFPVYVAYDFAKFVPDEYEIQCSAGDQGPYYRDIPPGSGSGTLVFLFTGVSPGESVGIAAALFKKPDRTVRRATDETTVKVVERAPIEFDEEFGYAGTGGSDKTVRGKYSSDVNGARILGQVVGYDVVYAKTTGKDPAPGKGENPTRVERKDRVILDEVEVQDLGAGEWTVTIPAAQTGPYRDLPVVLRVTGKNGRDVVLGCVTGRIHDRPQ